MVKKPLGALGGSKKRPKIKNGGTPKGYRRL